MNDSPERWAAVGAAITARMRDLAMSQTELVKASGVSDFTIRRLRNGEVQNYRSDRLQKLSIALWGRPDAIERLLDGDVPTPPDGGTPTALGADELQLAALAGKLTPERRAIVEQLARSLLAEQDD